MTKMTVSKGVAYAAGAALALAVTACGADADTPSAASSPPSAANSSTATSATTPRSAVSPTTPPPARDTPAGRSIAITVQGKKVAPAPSTIDLKAGETLTLVITSDHDDEVHVHGFDVEAKLRAGTPTTVALKGAQPGLFEVETHEPPLRLLMIAVR